MAGYIGTQAVSVNTTSATISDDLTVGGDVAVTTGDGAILNLQTSDTTVTDGSVLGAINFTAPSEGSGTDAILLGAAIEAVAEGTFAADNNATELVFKTGASAAANAKMTLSSAGQLGIGIANHHDAATLLSVNGRINVDNDTVIGSMNLGNGSLINVGTLTNHNLQIMSKNTTRMLFTGAGVTSIANGLTLTDGNLTVAAGHGIDFAAQTRSSATGVGNHAELLDHYEEGTWTPTFAGAGGSAGDAALSNFGSTYTRVGNLVTVMTYFRITNVGSYSGNISFGGLPFAAINTNGARVVGSYAPLKKVELVDDYMYVPSILKNTIVIEMSRITGSDQGVKSQAQVSYWNDNLNENVITLTYNTA